MSLKSCLNTFSFVHDHVHCKDEPSVTPHLKHTFLDLGSYLCNLCSVDFTCCINPTTTTLQLNDFITSISAAVGLLNWYVWTQCFSVIHGPTQSPVFHVLQRTALDKALGDKYSPSWYSSPLKSNASTADTTWEWWGWHIPPTHHPIPRLWLPSVVTQPSGPRALLDTHTHILPRGQRTHHTASSLTLSPPASRIQHKTILKYSQGFCCLIYT